MSTPHERHLSRAEAARLATLIDERWRSHPFERDDLDALDSLLANAHLVDAGALPDDAVALGRRVVVRTHDGSGTERCLVLCPPHEADPARGRLSVVSPLGRALLGLRAGARVPLALPGGRAVDVEVVDVTGPAGPAAGAAVVPLPRAAWRPGRDEPPGPRAA